LNGFIDHSFIPLGTTSNYSAIANLHTLQIATAPAKLFPTCCVFISRSLTTASNSGNSSASRSQDLLSTVNSTTAPSLLSLPCRAQLNRQPSTNWISPVLFFVTILHGPHRKCRSSIVACMFVATLTWRLLCRYPVTDVSSD
jgi:hypothetical protein